MTRQHALRSAIIALTVLFGLQLIRVLFPLFAYYLRDTRGMSSISLAPIALGVFALSFLASPLRRLAGIRMALAITTGGVTLLRAVEQLSANSALDTALAAGGVALFTMFIPIALELTRPEGAQGTNSFALALLVGVTADTAVHTAASTVDLSWQRSALVAAAVLLLAGASLFLLWRFVSAIQPSPPITWGWARILALAAFGPWLFLQLIVFQNVARLGSITGWPLPVAGLAIGLGNVVGLVAAAHAPRAKSIPGLTILIAVVFVVILFRVDSNGLLGAVISLAGQVLAASLLTGIFTALGWSAARSGRMGAPAANGIGQLLFVILSFVYYITFDMILGFRGPALIPIAAILIAIAAVASNRRPLAGREPTANELPTADYLPLLVGALLLLLPLGLWLTWRTASPANSPTDSTTIRIMDYNLHNGFNADGQLNMEALAQVIEASGADIIGLQEVSRGWVINGSADMLQWLARRLEMYYVFGSSEGVQWGNAIFSRYPIVEAKIEALPPDSLALRRGYIQAEIDAGQAKLQIIATHLHQIEEDSTIRQQQVPGLLAAWNGKQKTILMGDMNATPDSLEMRLLSDAGLVELAAAIGPDPAYTFNSVDPNRQIDYIWISPDLAPSGFQIPQTTASDHLPLVAVIALP